jgi:hypothetical protein
VADENPVVVPKVETPMLQVPEAEWKALNEKVAQLPGMVKRIVSESVPKVELAQPVAQKEDKYTKLEAELNAMKTGMRDSKIQGEIISAASPLGFFDPVNDVVGRLKGKVVEKDGKFVVPGKQKLEATGAEIDVEYSIADAVKQIAVERPYLVKGQASNAEPIGATGRADTLNALNAPSDYNTLLANPNLMGAWLAKDPATVERLRQKASAEKKK